MPDPEPTNTPTPAPATDPTPAPAPATSKTTPAPTPQDGAGSNPPANTPEPTDKKPENPAPLPNEPDDLDTDITNLAQSDDAQKAEADEKAKADFDAYVKAAGLENGVTDILLKKGENGQPDVTLRANEVGAIMSVLLKSGIEAGKAKDMVGMVAALDKYRAKAQEESDRRVLRAIREETRKEFGESLGAASRDMVSAGNALFGAELWADICSIPALTNDKRFVRAMAAYGARLRNDNGGPAPAQGGAAAPSGDRPVFDLDAWTKGSGG